MKIENPKVVQNILLDKINTVETGLLTAYPQNGLEQQLKKGSRYNGTEKVESFLSFHPAAAQQSIDLVFAVACTARGAIFSSEITWSDGKVIDEVVVCEVCPQCFDQLGERVDNVVAGIQDSLVERMVDLLENFS
ncbi:hypothetical protein ACFLZW_00940 [Chloroflexota bacterium]